jgi:hypothetical protein
VTDTLFESLYKFVQNELLQSPTQKVARIKYLKLIVKVDSSCFTEDVMMFHSVYVKKLTFDRQKKAANESGLVDMWCG